MRPGPDRREDTRRLPALAPALDPEEADSAEESPTLAGQDPERSDECHMPRGRLTQCFESTPAGDLAFAGAIDEMCSTP